MKGALQGQPVKDFLEPENIESKRVCMESGLLSTHACPRARLEMFKYGTSPVKTCNVHGVGAATLDVLSDGGAPKGDLMEMEAAAPSVPDPNTAVTQPAAPEPVPQSSSEQAYQDEGF